MLFLGVIETFSQTVSPLLTTKFGQGTPYNNSCPEGTVAGCGPVAIAQILCKYKQPNHGYGSVSYISGSNKIPIDENLDNIAFDWSHIKDDYKGAYTDEEAKAVAELVYICGVAMNAQYGSNTGVTNYWRMLYELQHNLHISKEVRYLKRQYYTTAEWIEILNSQLRAGHPVFYRGDWLFDESKAGHMFVVDGLDSDGKYHVNFGHSGSGDKFVDLNVLNQSGTNPGGRGVCYNANQAMVINCYPTPNEDSYPLQSCISEEEIILNHDSLLKNVTVELGKVFSLSCRLRNCSLEKANIEFGWGLEKDGSLIQLLVQKNYVLRAGYKFNTAVHLNITLPENLEDGHYQLALYSKSDIEPNWVKVWEYAPINVDVDVENGEAVVAIPGNHQGNPNLYLESDIKEVDNTFESVVSGRTFELRFVNPSTNNFLNKIRLNIVADGTEYSFETIQAIYSQSKMIYQILVPQERVNLKEKQISSIKAYYFNSESRTYCLLGTADPTSINQQKISENGDINIYTLNGMLVKHIPAKEVSEQYYVYLKRLPKGCYIVKEANQSRKINL